LEAEIGTLDSAISGRGKPGKKKGVKIVWLLG
jgi:hypothetical protein